MRKLSIIMALLFLSAGLWARPLTLADLRSATRRYIDDNNADSYHFSNDVIDLFLNIAQNEIAGLTFCLEGTTTYAINYAQREYILPNKFFTAQRVTLNGYLLAQRDIPALDNDTSWEVIRTTAVPSYYYIKHTTYSVIGFDVPPSTSTRNTINLTYVKIPEVLTNDSDVPFDGYPRLQIYHNLVSLLASAHLCWQDRRPDEGDRYHKIYGVMVEEMSKTIRLTPNFYPNVGIGKGYFK